jgi:hypothetical protein
MTPLHLSKELAASWDTGMVQAQAASTTVDSCPIYLRIFMVVKKN